eukprot:COSAG03_NODE_15585_length_426_cov_1.272171_1_plen_63_part_01
MIHLLTYLGTVLVRTLFYLEPPPPPPPGPSPGIRGGGGGRARWGGGGGVDFFCVFFWGFLFCF